MSKEIEDPSWLKEVLGRISAESEVDRAIDTTLRLMSDHTLRKSDMSTAVKEFETEYLKVKAIISRNSPHSKGGSISLPTSVDIDGMSRDEVSELKKTLCSLVSACDKKLS